VLHPTFEIAVKDDIIRKNPTDGVMKEISKISGKNRGIRRALTKKQQKVFMEYMTGHPIYYHWWPLFVVLLGTGMRIGECIGLRWDDLDFESGFISINHAITYYKSGHVGRQVMTISNPKTEAGIRTVPMLDVVREAFEMEREQQFDMLGGLNEQVIDGMSGFVFQNRDGHVPNPQTVNDTIKRIVASYNAEETLNAAKEKRDPVILPSFSCHVLRHTFATRLCEAESNLKVIQDVMGHKSVETTMDIYAEATNEKKQASFEGLANKLAGLF
jgi:integrase